MHKFTLTLLAVFISAFTWAQDEEPITTLPDDAQSYTFTREGESFYPQRYGEEIYIYEGNQGGSMSVAFMANGEVYLKDPVYGYRHGTYVKGTLSADGKTITIPVPQILFNDPINNVPILLGIGKFDEDSKEYSLDEEIKEVVYAVSGADGDTLTLQGASKQAPLGNFWADDKSFAGRGEWETVLVKYVEKTEVVEIAEEQFPDAREMPLGGAYWVEGKPQTINNNIKVYVDANDIVYAQGLVPMLPETWVKGVIKNGVASFPVQLLGKDGDQKSYLAGLSGDGLNLAPFTMAYDSILGSYAAGNRLIVNSSDLDYDAETTVLAYYTGIYVGQRPEQVQLPEYITEAEVMEVPYEGVYDDGAHKTETAGVLKMVIDNESVYIQGLVKGVPEAWVKGTIDNLYQNIYIDLNQYAGFDAFGSVYLVGDKWDQKEFLPITESVDDPAKVHFSFDYDTKTLRLMNNLYFSRKADNINRSNLLRAGLTINDGALWIAANQDYENAAEVTEASIAEGITATFAQADNKSNAPKYYANGLAVRLYAGNTLTIKSVDQAIGKVAIQFVSSDDAQKSVMLEAADGEFTITDSLGIWTGDASEVVFTVPNESGNQARIKSIMVFGFDYSSTLATVPENLVTDAYKMTATVTENWTETEKTIDVLVGFNGNDVYFQGLSQNIPEAWVKGRLADGKVTIPGWYLGTYELYGGLMTASEKFGETTFDYDAETGTFTVKEYKVLDPNAISEDWADVEVFENVTIAKSADVAATPQTPEILAFEYLDVEQPYILINVLQEDADHTLLHSDKLGFVVMVDKGDIQEPLTFKTAEYTALESDLTEIPYVFTDRQNISRTRIDLLQSEEEMHTWNKIGLQSIYRGGGEERKTEIEWLDLQSYWAAAGISTIQSHDGKVVFFDMQGRQANASAKGLLIKQMRMADGSVKTVKILRK